MTEGPIDWYGAEVATLGDRLTAAREQASLSVGEISQLLGIRTSTWQSWEEDLSEPRASELSRASGILSVSVRWLLTGEGAGIPEPEHATPASSSTGIVLASLRELRGEIKSASDRLAMLESQLRSRLKN
jgi:transcriptional regulator with XRE-family HTH domain